MGTNKRGVRAFTMAVAAELRAERAAVGATQEQLARASGIPASTVRHILAGRVTIDLEQLSSLSSALGLDIEVLVARARARAALGC